MTFLENNLFLIMILWMACLMSLVPQKPTAGMANMAMLPFIAYQLGGS